MTVTVPRKVLYAIGGVTLLVIAGLLGALIAGGDSETTTTTVISTVEAAESDIAATEESDTGGDGSASSEDSPDGSCDAKGINRDVGKEGTCTEDGREYVVVNRDSTLRLHELNAKILDTETTTSVSDEFGTSKSANGIYVIFDLEVFNKTSSPLYFDSSQEQAFLYLGENEYTEDFEVENYSLDDSFVNTFEEIQPETSTTGSIAFDIPPKLVPDLERDGNLAILNFSDEGEGENVDQLGIIRTYR